MSIVLSIDQSTQGTKAMLFDENGQLFARYDLPHEQKINELGWVSHDAEEIWQNTKEAVRLVIEKAGIDAGDIVTLGISNQRETSVVWEKETGSPVCDAIVWQCGRAADLCARIEQTGIGEEVRHKTGIPISPFFPASKFAWILENIEGTKEKAKAHKLCFGTVDTFLVWKMTNGQSYKTDYSNASRTQLFNILTLAWDEAICKAFGLDASDLPTVTPSDGDFGVTDLDGVLPRPVPILGVLGDSHAALFGQGGLAVGTAKATYGTGSSIMMNIGEKPIESQNGLVTSLAFAIDGKIHYAMEGNLNYSAAVIRWMEKDLGLIASAAESEAMAKAAHPDDTTYLVPAFTGLGAPYWDNDARATISGISRLTGRNELVKAGLDCIAYQITDVVKAMEQDAGVTLPALRADGGATRNGYLMQMQSDLLGADVVISEAEELSGIGAAFAAGIKAGVYGWDVFASVGHRTASPKMPEEIRERKLAGWKKAVAMTLYKGGAK